ncbi:MAG: hypothetical protein WC379_14345, partial [Methanoregula sp.]
LPTSVKRQGFIKESPSLPAGGMDLERIPQRSDPAITGTPGGFIRRYGCPSTTSAGRHVNHTK